MSTLWILHSSQVFGKNPASNGTVQVWLQAGTVDVIGLDTGPGPSQYQMKSTSMHGLLAQPGVARQCGSAQPSIQTSVKIFLAHDATCRIATANTKSVSAEVMTSPSWTAQPGRCAATKDFLVAGRLKIQLCKELEHGRAECLTVLSQLWPEEGMAMMAPVAAPRCRPPLQMVTMT